MPQATQGTHVFVTTGASRFDQKVLATLAATVLLVCAVLTSRVDAYVPTGTERDLDEVMELVTGNALSFDLLPKDLVPELGTLAERWHGLRTYQPDPAEIEQFWKKYGPKDQELTEQNSRAVGNILRRSKFVSENLASIKKRRKAAAETLYKRIAAQSDVDPKKAVCFAAVPFPCPSPEIYRKAISFVDAACGEAKGKSVQIVLVRSPYGRKDLLKKSEAQNWWWPEISALPTRYADAMKSGVLRISDSFPSQTNTPWGFVFRNGELVAEGNLANWGDNPSPVLKQFAETEKK